MYNQKDLLLGIMIMPYTNLEILELMYEEKIFETECKDLFENKFIAKLLEKNQTIYSIDEVKLLIDKFYKQRNLKKEVSVDEILLEHLKKIAKSFLSHRNGSVCIKYWNSNETDYANSFLGPYEGLSKISLWNSINRMMSMDTLVCLYLAQKNCITKRSSKLFDDSISLSDENDIEVLEDYYHQVKLEDLQLSAVLKNGIAETHLHASAGKNFFQTWSMLMNCGRAECYINQLKLDIRDWIENKSSIVKNKYFEKLVLEANILRYFLVWQIYQKNTNKNNLLHQLDISIQRDAMNQNKYAMTATESYLDPFSQLLRSETLVDERLNRFNEKELYALYFWLYKYLMSVENIDSSNNLDKFQEDPLIWKYLNTSSKKNIKTMGENIFLFKVFKYIENSNRSDDETVHFLMRYICIKNMIFQEHIQFDQIKGLQNFMTYFKTSTNTMKPNEKTIFWKQILQNQMQDENLKKLELRVGLNSGKTNAIKVIKDNFLKELKIILKVYLELIDEKEVNESKNFIENQSPIIGIIIHFIKKYDDNSEKCWIEYDENKKKTYKKLDYQKERVGYSKELLALKELIYEYDYLSKFIVGIDAASDENCTEPWVFAPIYDYARDGNNRMLNVEKKSINHLGFTFHVGEDFRHILTGLRRIDEVIEHFKYHAGDRIGHGIALGIEISKWIQNHPVVVLPRIEYLENLLWIWGMYKGKKLVSGIDGFLERRIMQIANDIYITLEGITVFELWKAYRMKFEEVHINDTFKSTKNVHECESILKSEKSKGFVNRLFCCETSEQNAHVWNSEKLSLTYHCKVYRERMLEPISIASNELNLDILNDIQNILCKRVSSQGIIVETNPTSNRAIGEIEDIFEHYILSLKNKTFLENTNSSSCNNNIIVSINTDDPSVFQTSLSSEFAYIYYSLLDKGYAKKEVLDWIDEVRKNGMTSSFIENRSLTQVRDEIQTIINQINVNLLGRA